MLCQLHGHVEREESRWSRYSAELQRQLDEARRQLDERILRDSNYTNPNKRKGLVDNEEEDECEYNDDTPEVSAV